MGKPTSGFLVSWLFIFLVFAGLSRNQESKLIRARKNLLKKYLVSLVLFVIFVFTSIVGLMFFPIGSGYETTLQTRTGIIVGQYPYHPFEIGEIHYAIDLNPINRTMVLDFYFNYYTKGNYALAIALPFVIAEMTPLHYETSTDWIFINASSGSVIMLTYNAKEDPLGFDQVHDAASIEIEGAVSSRVFESYSLDLPFGGSFTLDVQEKWDKLREVLPIASMGDGFNGTLSIVLPQSSTITGLTHQIHRRDPAKNVQILQFQMYGSKPFKPFFIQYVVPEERYLFERNIFLSGIFIGAAVSSLIGCIVEFVKSLYPNQ